MAPVLLENRGVILWCELEDDVTLSCLVSVYCVAVAFLLELEAVVTNFVISLYYKLLLSSSQASIHTVQLHFDCGSYGLAVLDCRSIIDLITKVCGDVGSRTPDF